MKNVFSIFEYMYVLVYVFIQSLKNIYADMRMYAYSIVVVIET